MSDPNAPSELTYTPAWWVPGAHLQTLWGKLVRRAPVVVTRAERWDTSDGDDVEVRRIDGNPGAPRLVLLHGLEGSIRSAYLLGMLSRARDRGWAADALIFRGCDGGMNRAPRMYHSGETSDIDMVVRRLVREAPGQPIVIAGFSLGGNVLLKWLGEQGTSVPREVRAAAAVSVPYDLERGARHIERGFSRIYTQSFLRTLKLKAAAKLARHPGLFDEARMRAARTLYEFDDAVTAPMHGFTDAHDYYSRSSSIHFLTAIRTPTLLLSSRDDPFVPPLLLETVASLARTNNSLSVEFREKGGHVGFVSGTSPLSSQFYAEERVMEFLAGAAERDLPRVR